jgi:hypothetical protein
MWAKRLGLGRGSGWLARAGYVGGVGRVLMELLTDEKIANFFLSPKDLWL